MIRCEFRLMARPEWMNGMGTLHGAEYVKILDELSGVTADAHDPLSYVTGSVHHFRYLLPVYARDVLHAVGVVLYTTRHTVVIDASLYVRRRLEKEEYLAAHGYFVMVANKPNEKTTLVAPYFHEDPDILAHAENVRQMIEAFDEIKPLS